MTAINGPPLNTSMTAFHASRANYLILPLNLRPIELPQIRTPMKNE